MSIDKNQLEKLRQVITENLRVQREGVKPVPYIDVNSALTDMRTRQNHAVFARRGCGKTLLLHQAARGLPNDTRAIYLNCEDFKHHSFPNVLIEVLDTLFGELQRPSGSSLWSKLWASVTGSHRNRSLREVRKMLSTLREQDDEANYQIVESHTANEEQRESFGAGLSAEVVGVSGSTSGSRTKGSSVQLSYEQRKAKLAKLHAMLPELKNGLRSFFSSSKLLSSAYLQLDDFYHLARKDQPDVMDYIHRLCKDVPLYFKVATLRHSSSLYADRDGQPIGAQERHDYQPINIDFTFSDFPRTAHQNRMIFLEFAKLANLGEGTIDALFKGEGFERLIMAGGGVPRDCLSLFIETLEVAKQGDGRIGKDDVRIMSRSNFERRIEELKQDSAGEEQRALIRGIYVLRRFCIDRKTNVMMVPEEMMQQSDIIRTMMYRLLDYRIIHASGTAITHKSAPGTYQAFAIDIGCYAHLRKLQGRFNEIDVSKPTMLEKLRSAPILSKEQLDELWSEAPADIETALKSEDEESFVSR